MASTSSYQLSKLDLGPQKPGSQLWNGVTHLVPPYYADMLAMDRFWEKGNHSNQFCTHIGISKFRIAQTALTRHCGTLRNIITSKQRKDIYRRKELIDQEENGRRARESNYMIYTCEKPKFTTIKTLFLVVWRHSILILVIWRQSQ